MPPTLSKVTPGDPLAIPAAAYNAFVDAARAVQADGNTLLQVPQSAFQQSGIILVRNDSGADPERFDVLGIDEPVFDPADDEDAFKNRVALAGVVPTSADHSGRFVVLLEPITAGEVGRACIAGVCPAWVNFEAEGDSFADVYDGDATQLKGGAAGAAQVLWKQEGTGPLWAVVRMGNDALLDCVGFGVPADGETDVPHDADIDLTVTDANGNPILDAEGQEQTIRVWRNALRHPLYTDFDADSIFVYVKFPQPAPSGHGGCIFSRTEAFVSYREWLPPDGYSLYPETEQPPEAADATGDPGDEDHVYVIGKMYMGPGEAGGKGWTPWFVIDPSKLAPHDLLNGDTHPDTADAALAGDMICAHLVGENVVWDRLGVGAAQSILYVSAAGLPAWLAKGADNTVLKTVNGALVWGAGVNQPNALLDGVNHNDTAAHAPLAGDIVYSAAAGTWSALVAGAQQSIMYVSAAGLPAWFAAGAAQSILYVDGTGALNWFNAGLEQSLLITGANGALAWKPRGLNESLFITRNGDLDWLTKGNDPSVLVADGGTVQWSHGSDATGRGAVLWIDQNGVLGWGQANHGLLDSVWHYDTNDALPSVGAMIYGTGDQPGGKWDALEVGSVQSLLYVNNSSLPAWFAAGEAQSILYVDADAQLGWLGPPMEGPKVLTYTEAGSLSWDAGATFTQDVPDGPPEWSGDTLVQKYRTWTVRAGLVVSRGDQQIGSILSKKPFKCPEE